MGEPRTGVDHAVIDEATKWFALLRSDAATGEDRRAFESWRSADPQHAAAYEQTLSIWEDVGALGGLEDLVTAPEGERPPLSSRRAILYGALAAALGLVVVVPALIDAQPGWLLPDVHATRMAETRPIVLPDGSVADLAPKSKIRVAYSAEDRRIYLHSGEAFFDVRENDPRAFFVISGETEVRVTGTKFNVRQGPSGVTVSVAEGEVVVRRRAPRRSAEKNGAPIERLSAGEQVAAPARGDGLSDVIATPLATIASWRAGRLTYKGAPLREFIADANRYSPIAIIADESLLGLPLVASLRSDQIDPTIDSLPEILPLRVDRSRRDRIVLRAAAGQTP